MGDLEEQLSTLQQIEREELARAYREVFAMPSGKRVLFDILTDCAIYQDAFTGDDNATNYTLGLQAGGRRLIGKLDQIDPRFYPTLLLAVADLKAMDQAAANSSATQGNDDDQDA
ncbi:hypothetical protein HB779_17410 [Phyllobacterium sp. 628]|nr:hypothetical protein HB779_17410 [Phyllobacterium sp. 628]